jgi:hypothetical protein
MSKQGKATKTTFARSISLVIFFAAGLLIGLFLGIYVAWHPLVPSNPTIPASATPVDITPYVASATPVDITPYVASATPVDITPYVHIKNNDDLERKRQELIQIIWGNNYQPNKQPFRVTENIHDERIKELRDIQRTDLLEIDLNYGIKSFAYLFNPQPGRPLAIYHQGHDGSFFIGKTTIQRFIDQGYMVLCYSMPLIGDNNRPIINISGIGPIEFTEHDRLKFLDHPISYFMEPILEGTNYVQDQYQPGQIAMVGYSGGGWSTTLYAAIDPRINMSFPVAGSLPIVLRNRNDWGDFEQTFPELYQNINYLDLYIMGSSGNNRVQLQVLNQFDSCCFAGTKNSFYEQEITEIASSLGGKFSVYLDDSHKSHMISPTALDRILHEIDSFFSRSTN